MSQTNPETFIASHVPVLHRGYVELFDRHPSAPIGVFDESITGRFDYLRKDVRALDPELAVRMITGMGRAASTLSIDRLAEVGQDTQTRLVMPHDDLSRQLVQQLDLRQATLEPVFLRWDRDNAVANKEVKPTATISIDDLPDTIVTALRNNTAEGTNWWRHVGAVIASGDTIIASTRNASLPTDYSLYIDGDPRITANRGSSIETSIDIHAESRAIAEMARAGTSLEGASIYVSDFPCPNCAKLIAASGIKECYYVDGYAMVDGQTVLESAGVTITRVDGDVRSDDHSLALPYPEKKSS